MSDNPVDTRTPPFMERRVGQLEIAHAELSRDFHHMSQAMTKIADGQEALVSAVQQMVRDRAQLEQLQVVVIKLGDRLDAHEARVDGLSRVVDRNSFITRIASWLAGAIAAAIITAGVKGWL